MVNEEGHWFTLTGEFGGRYVIEATTNLAPGATVWTPVATLTNDFGRVEFLDLVATNFTQRFYRSVLEERLSRDTGWLSYALKKMVWAEIAAVSASRMSNERSAGELHPRIG